MIGEILQKNLESIAQYNPFHIEELLSLDFCQIGNEVKEELSTKGRSEVLFYHGDQKLLLHSRYSLDAEAARIIGDVEVTRDYLFIVFGIGIGHHLFALKEKISPETRVVIVEHNLDVLKYALTHIDFTEVFASGQFVLAFGDDKQVGKMVLALGGLGFYKLVHNARVLSLPNYYVYAEQNKSAVQHIYKVLLNTFLSFGNDLEDQFLGFTNICDNTDAIMDGYSIDDIAGKYMNVPAIIVASGPSLDKNIEHLKNANGKALIIACDASMRACDKHNVRPDAVASIERIVETYKYFYQDRTFPNDLVLLAPGSVWPAICAEFPGKMVLAPRNNTGFEKLWIDAFDHFKFLNMGHSCATLAFSAARVAGCNPIILVGQDLAYTSGKHHSNLTHYGTGLNDVQEDGGVYLEDHEGNLLKSSIIFRIFKEWFELQIVNDQRLQVIDATEGGAYIKGTKLMTLEKAITEYCQTPIHKRLVECLPENTVSPKQRIRKFDKLLKMMHRDLNALKRIKKAAEAHQKTLMGMEDALRLDRDKVQLEKDVLKMQRGDKVIQRIMASEALESYYSPIILQTIVQVKKIGNELTAENVKRNYALQQNLMFMIANSTDLIIDEYTNAREILEQKRSELDG